MALVLWLPFKSLFSDLLVHAYPSVLQVSVNSEPKAPEMEVVNPAVSAPIHCIHPYYRPFSIIT